MPSSCLLTCQWRTPLNRNRIGERSKHMPERGTHLEIRITACCPLFAPKPGLNTFDKMLSNIFETEKYDIKLIAIFNLYKVVYYYLTHRSFYPEQKIEGKKWERGWGV